MSGQAGDAGRTTAEASDPESVLRDVREAFIRAFEGRLSSVSALLTGGRVDRVSRERARELLHRMAGLAGMIGFPGVSTRAAELEETIRRIADQESKVAEAEQGLAAIREAFDKERAVGALPEPGTPVAARPNRILLVEDDDDQRAVLESWLRSAGYQPAVVNSGDGVLPAVRERRPALVLMDVELPGPDGVAVCRLLKADPALATLPVVLMSTRRAPEDRIAGLSAGADEYLNKPVDLQELLLWIQRLLSRREGAGQPSQTESALDAETFARVARAELSRAATALALVRVPPEHRQTAPSLFLSEVRRRDLLGTHDASHLVLLLVDIPSSLACRRVRDILDALAARGMAGLHAGVAVAPPGQRSLEELLAEADEALTEARYLGEPAAMRTGRGAAAGARVVMVAEDDPEVTRIVDAQLKAAGYKTVICFDGRQALEALQSGPQPDVLLLDLLMPKLTGFGVLARLREMPARPRVIVLSGHGREEDVTRAFDLGADDYLTKPFSPRELIARVARLLKD
ncbi:MAG TPA: response regulator [Vicinamibacteria bacterium]|nr:response regulator [Vicinamibacteria bacterium]